MRIGISVISHAGQNIWENGLGQNVIFLAQLFQRLSFVRSVVLIDVGDQDRLPDQVDAKGLSLPVMKPVQATDAVDVIVEMAGALPGPWLALQRARGKKVVYYCAGHPFAGIVEGVVFERPGFFPQAERCDEVWVIPEYAMFGAFQRTLHRCPVRVVPYVWHPQFVQKRVQEVTQLGYSYGWKHRESGGDRPGFRVAIFEPNVSVVKTSSISLLACDEAYRAQPQSIQMMHALNTVHMKDHPTLLYLANSLSLVREHKACFHGRHDIVGFMCQHADAVISHQWTNDQNYSYLDALYGDYPLIHNSPWLHGFGAGYYYPGFEAAEAGRQLVLAWQEHDLRLSAQRQARDAVFASVDPASEANLSAYAELLRALCQDSPSLLEG